MNDIAIDFTAFSQAIHGINIGNSSYVNVVGVVIVFLCSLAVTRNINKIQVIQLPMAVAWSAAGVGAGWIPLIIYSILFVTNSFSLSDLGAVMTASVDRGLTAVEKGKILMSQAARTRYRGDAALARHAMEADIDERTWEPRLVAEQRKKKFGRELWRRDEQADLVHAVEMGRRGKLKQHKIKTESMTPAELIRLAEASRIHDRRLIEAFRTSRDQKAKAKEAVKALYRGKPITPSRLRPVEADIGFDKGKMAFRNILSGRFFKKPQKATLARGTRSTSYQRRQERETSAFRNIFTQRYREPPQQKFTKPRTPYMTGKQRREARSLGQFFRMQHKRPQQVFTGVTRRDDTVNIPNWMRKIYRRDTKVVVKRPLLREAKLNVFRKKSKRRFGWQ